ncbi:MULTISPECIES: MATE family efflux transporter [unclassified Streptomyces]|uniref:MATE family efflux transporter n=1 Tax=unclassified Streptomyces TaxID=2593676 RepID=UPI001370CB4C|nr:MULTISPECIES: MATE family efflux transporter [unclassified Streptomyces]NEA03230.1 MATE family efflux transporter [Streptomyces sp. SID10116]MYY85440.1 MATE family efflux transporter [Streptomyces sp. SID335]MYZ13467.1 MATE family efflux transporter [Streptomyces sp. SID337]NDZ87334.1 MATE family efflux transporter [Streptomyces sp. SID10115]NEB48505.1 MATE family efflux transporter [Streptomyces sp. SID339]
MGPTEHRRRLVSLALPVYGELLAGVTAGIINMVWVAGLGGAAVAAVAVATNVENVLLGVILMAGSGTTVLVARARGAGDLVAERSAVRGGWVMWALITPVVAVGGYVCRERLARWVLGEDGGTSVYLATQYFAIALPGMAVYFATNVVDGILKGSGDTRTPMRLALLANGLILVLDPLLILGCDLGVRGAAIATVAGRSVALICGLSVLRPSLGPSGLGVRSLVADARRTAATGLPMSADFVVRMTGTLALVGVVARVGVDEVAAYGIATKATYVATMAFYSVRQAAAIHTAHLLGAGRDERRAVAREALRIAGAVGATAALVLLAAAPLVMRGFGAEGAVADAGVLYLRCLGPYLVLLACFIGVAGVYEGGGSSPALARITTGGVVVQLVLAYALLDHGLPGICGAMACAVALQCAALTRVSGGRRTRRNPSRRGRTGRVGGHRGSWSRVRGG